jgi:hypothetical protein
MKLVVVSAGLSVPSSTRLLGDRLAADVGRQTPVDVQVVDSPSSWPRSPGRRGREGEVVRADRGWGRVTVRSQ